MLKYILFIIAVGTLCCCKEPFITIKRSSARPAQVKVIYPPEKSEIEAMQIGDTVNIFYKKTGWFQPLPSIAGLYRTSYYNIETIWRVDTAKYLYTHRWAYPDAWFGKPLEFDSLKNHPEELFRTIGRLEYWCGFDTIIKWDGNYEICIDTLNISPKDSIGFAHLKSRELTSSKYQKWRFSPPNSQELNQWNASIPESSITEYRYEIITISKDTIKMSFSDQSHALFPLVYCK